VVRRYVASMVPKTVVGAPCAWLISATPLRLFSASMTDWPPKGGLLDAQLYLFGDGWEKGGAGRREDGCVHVCLSRAGLLYDAIRTFARNFSSEFASRGFRVNVVQSRINRNTHLGPLDQRSGDT
jgi:hypothetical protein